MLLSVRCMCCCRASTCYLVPAVLEVFILGPYAYANKDQARAACNNVGATLATLDQVKASFNRGAENCGWGYTATDAPGGGTFVAYPMQTPNVPGCSGAAGVQQAVATPTWWNNGVLGAQCYGLKPWRDTPNIGSFRQTPDTWSERDYCECSGVIHQSLSFTCGGLCCMPVLYYA